MNWLNYFIPYPKPIELEPLEWVNFKHNKDRLLFVHLNPTCLCLLVRMANYTKSKGHILTITSTVSTKKEDTLLKRKSDTHLTRRAFDVRINDMSQPLIKDLIAEFNRTYAHLGAKAIDGSSRLIVHESDHLHVQLDRLFAEPPIDERLWNWASKQ